MNYKDAVETLSSAARRAGEFMLGAAPGDTASKDKTNKKDFVTVADIKSQDILTAELKRAFPEMVVISEEHGESEQKQMYSRNFTGFVIDPIDGTYNFKRGMKESAVSVGLIEDGEPVAGVVYDPYRNELYSAVKGEGAKLNGLSIGVSAQGGLAGASVATSNSYDDGAMARNLRRHLSIYEHTQVMPWTSCPGSGVLIMAWVACGRIDAYHHNGLKPWDNAAAFLLVREAGGIVERLGASEDALFTDSKVLIGTPGVTKKIRGIFDQLEERELLD